jgi:hypothetical protein
MTAGEPVLFRESPSFLALCPIEARFHKLCNVSIQAELTIAVLGLSVFLQQLDLGARRHQIGWLPVSHPSRLPSHGKRGNHSRLALTLLSQNEKGDFLSPSGPHVKNNSRKNQG